MAAGPYPTKAMFEALKGRVGTLENGGTPPAGAEGGPYASLSLFSPTGRPQATPTPASSALISWSRRSVYVAGIELEGDVHLNGLSVLGANMYEGRSYEFSLDQLRRTVTGSGVYQRTLFLLPTPILVTDGGIALDIAEDAVLQLYGTPVTVPTAMRIEASKLDGNRVDCNFNVTIYEAPLEGVRVVPEPTEPTGNFTEYEANYTPPRMVEVVWPAASAPYLHVVVFSSVTADGRGFHVPLTPGLPQ
ncbi:hypothetical protein Dcar01_02404 [Deinococcus carri]|uniref:Uncharacterized protein n=1 Tax=Deinococcus carri TaxID=1211323 RepID=A0ABP9W8I3_9DEIO